MVYDFGLMKNGLEDIIDSFDHAVTLWDQDDKQYLENMKQASARWVQIPINPTAEQFSRIFFVLIDKILKLTNMKNNEKEVLLQSIIVHETKTGYAQCFREDAYNENMGKIKLEKIIFSPQVQKEWQNPNLFEKMLKNEKFENPKEI
jgi:6-pyruvoyltetrahydropterin/6-carboxytetrahydropterin synthase